MANFLDSIGRFLEQLWATLEVIAYVFLIVLGRIIVSIFGDPNYTGGDPNAMNGRAQGDWWWVETYEECLDAIDQLEAKGSTFDTSALFTYEGDEFDVKYCFVLEGRFYIKYGRDNPFKYKNEDVKIYTFLFNKDTTIDDIVYSSIGNHCSYYFKMTPEYIENGKYQEMDAADLEVAFAQNLPYYTDHIDYFTKAGLQFIDKETGEVVFTLYAQREENMHSISAEAVDAILDSIVIVTD